MEVGVFNEMLVNAKSVTLVGLQEQRKAVRDWLQLVIPVNPHLSLAGVSPDADTHLVRVCSFVGVHPTVFVAKNQLVAVDWHPAVMVPMKRRRHHSHCAIDASVAVLVLNAGPAGPDRLHQPHAILGEVPDAADDSLEFLSQADLVLALLVFRLNLPI